QQLRSGPERLDRFVQGLHATARLREPQVGQRIRLVEADHLAKHLDRVAVAATALESRGDLVIRRERVARETQLRVDLRQPGHDVSVAIGALRTVLSRQLSHLPGGGAGFEPEALPRVALPTAAAER